MKVILVLCHSQNPAREITSFEKVMWGKPPNHPGRLVMATFEIMKSPESLIVLTGGTEFRRKNEAQEMQKCLFKNLSNINKFRKFFKVKSFDAEKMKAKLKESLILEKQAQTTFQNFQYSWELFKKKGIKVEELVVITSYDHLMKAVISAFEWRDKENLNIRINFVPSYISRFPSGLDGITLFDQKGKARIASAMLKTLSLPSAEFATSLKEMDENLPSGKKETKKDILEQLSV